MLDHCSGVDGTWGMQARWYEQSLKVADKLLEGVEPLPRPDHVATDCPLAALRIREGTGRKAVHPVVLLRDAYGTGGARRESSSSSPMTLLDLVAYELDPRDFVRRTRSSSRRLRRIARRSRPDLRVREPRHRAVPGAGDAAHRADRGGRAASSYELDVYNELIPGEDQLSATLMIEITDPERIKPTLDRLVGIDEHVVLEIGDDQVQATFDPRQFEEERISAVQYVRFRLGPELARRFKTSNAAVKLRVDHPGYTAETVLDPASRASLAKDL